MKMTNKNKKVVSATLALAVLVTGTFAWQSFSQEAMNKSKGTALLDEPGGRLHDYYNGENKDVFVENYASVEEGVDVYTRVRLDEYFEYGKGAGTGTDTTVLAGDIPKLDSNEDEIAINFEDESTWHAYSFGSTANGEETNSGDENIRTYRDLTFGGATNYLPTFNMNLENKDPDINGTIEGIDEDGNPADGWTNEEVRYNDYVEYTLAEEIEGTVLTYDEETSSQEAVANQLHTVSRTETATVISMEDWKEAGRPTGAFWVFDVDGWAYYAKGIAPQTATGLLLDSVQVITDPDQDWFYAVNVVAQVATAGDWGYDEKADGESDEEYLASSMYASGIKPDGLALLNQISGTVKITSVVITKTGGVTLELEDLNVLEGDTLELEADVTVYSPTNNPAEKQVAWSITAIENDTLDQADVDAQLDDGIFTAGADMNGVSFKITATSVYNPAESSSVVVTVTAPVVE